MQFILVCIGNTFVCFVCFSVTIIYVFKTINAGKIMTSLNLTNLCLSNYSEGIEGNSNEAFYPVLPPRRHENLAFPSAPQVDIDQEDPPPYNPVTHSCHTDCFRECNLQRNEILSLVEQGDPKKLEELLSCGANPNVTLADGNTPLMIAASRGVDAYPLLSLLVRFGADCNKQNDKGETALFLACVNARKKVSFPYTSCFSWERRVRGNRIVKKLLEAGANPNLKTKRAGTSVLHKACELGYHDVVEALMPSESNAQYKHKVKIDISNVAGETPLIIAAGSGHKALVELLLKNGADTSIRYSHIMGGMSALMMAVEHRHTEIVDLIVKHDMDQEDASERSLSLTDSLGRTALHRAAMNRDKKNFKTLCGQVECNVRDEMGRTVLYYLAMGGDCKSVKLLMSTYGKELKDLPGLSHYRTALSVAEESGDRRMLDLLRPVARDQELPS
jgi:ankyrin repeat protein